MINFIVVIPIYKSIPNEFELISFIQCLKVLRKHPITIITYVNLDTEHYTNLMITAKVMYTIEYFDSKYFESAATYNQLMLTKDFYTRFKAYKYMLIYQLDAYVFRDELMMWCDKGYDYIGAPLIEDKYGVENKYFLQGYNGGFSLRKIDYCIRFLSYKGPILKPHIIFKLVKIEFKDNPFKGFIFFILRSMGRQNNVNYFKSKTHINEDLLFSLGLYVSWVNSEVKKNEAWFSSNLPSSKEAIKFAFERYPSYLYELNNNQLPFGCHAWEKYEYERFWKKNII